VIARNGAIRWVGQNVHLLLKNGIIIGFRAAARDITERKLSEQRLKESEERIRQLADAASEGIMIHDSSVILDVNRSMLQMCLYDYHEVIGRKVEDFVLPRSRNIILQEKACGCDNPCEALLRKKDGTTQLLEVHEKSIMYQGKPAKIVVLLNSTERKRGEKPPPESEELFRMFVETAPEAVFVHAGRRFVYINRATLTLFGATSDDQLLGQSVMSRYHPITMQPSMSV